MKNDLSKLIAEVQDFPKQGIVFKDITPLLADGPAFKRVIDDMAALCRGRAVTKVVGIESRGFIFGAAVAAALGIGFVPARKAGKLPRAVESSSFSLEYGMSKIELHKDALTAADTVVIVDDVLATGGTMRAAAYLVRKLGAKLDKCIVLMELSALKGRDVIDVELESLVKF